MEIQIDSREHAKAIKDIVAEFDRQGINHFPSKLWVGDYQSLDNARLCIDRKQNLTELCGNVCQQHERFKAELVRAQKTKVKLIVLCEHGGAIKSMEDIKGWHNPRQFKYEQRIRAQFGIRKDLDFAEEVADLKSHGAKVQPPPTSGEQLYKMLSTISEKYNVDFLFCNKKETGRRIIEILGSDVNG
jgi:hypothetical protein